MWRQTMWRQNVASDTPFAELSSRKCVFKKGFQWQAQKCYTKCLCPVLYDFIKHLCCLNQGGSHSCFQVGSSEAASAALPALTMLAQDAEAKYGDNRKWPGQLSGGAE